MPSFVVGMHPRQTAQRTMSPAVGQAHEHCPVQDVHVPAGEFHCFLAVPARRAAVGGASQAGILATSPS